MWRNLLLRMLLLRVLLDSWGQLFCIGGESKAQTIFWFVMKIKGLSNYRGRNPHGYFQDLPWKVRQKAYAWLSRFLNRHPDCPGTRPCSRIGHQRQPLGSRRWKL